MSKRTDSLPEHIEETIQSMGRMQAEHHESAGPADRLIRFVTLCLGSPAVASGSILIVVAWIGLNLAVTMAGGPPLDPPPFQWLELFVSVASLIIIFVVLAAQQRDEELAEINRQLTLHLAMSVEQKTAKMIELLQTLRQDHPSLPDHIDEEAQKMAQPADPETLVNALKAAKP